MSGKRSISRMFALYALASLVPVVILGLVLASSFRAESNRRGLAEGTAEAHQIAVTSIQPLLSGRQLSSGLSRKERTALTELTSRVVGRHGILRLRVRDLRGLVVFSDDGSGFRAKPDDEALDAARGRTVSHLTRLNSDSNDSGPRGTDAVEVYLPLRAGTPEHRVGVLEVYLPYAPIRKEVSAGLHQLMLELAVGLLVLYLVLFAISASLSQGLRRAAAANAFLAEHDVLTGLPNRTLFQRAAQKAITRTARTGQPVTIAIADLDRFKDINDTLGHHSGDLLLQEVARRLVAAKRPADLVARLGGDEFGVIVYDQEHPESILAALLSEIDREVVVNDLPLSIQASLGYSQTTGERADVDELLQQADVAMYAAKAEHARMMRYDAVLDRYDPASLALVSQLRQAISDDQLVLHYQPQADPIGRRFHAVEALVRWQHPAHGLLLPDSFLPLAEQTDVIHSLTLAVLGKVLVDMRALPEHMCAAVNISARDIGRPGLADDVIRLLTEHRVPGHRLIIEVTETALLGDPERAAAVLRRLSEAGVTISLDDFGRGQTSLGYLSDLPLNELKIDRSFVSDMLENDAHAAIVRSMIDLGHNLGLRVVAEGIEDEATLRELSRIGCDLVQGYLLARPMPLDQTLECLEQRQPVV